MKKFLSLLLITILIVLSITGCGNETNNVSNENEVKDVTMLLNGIGGDLDTIKSLGQLPEPKVTDQLLFYNTKEIEGYFSGYNMGIEVAEDQTTVIQVYIQPYDGNQIKVNGFIIGCDVSKTNELFGKGELSSAEQNGNIFTYMTYKDDNYNIKCTVDNNKVTSVSFTELNGKSEEISEDTTGETTEVNQDDEEIEEIEPIQLSYYMTKDEIINKLGEDYIFETDDDGGYFMYCSKLEYDGITFWFYHDDEEIASDQIPDYINYTSNKYTFDFDIQIGDNAREVFKYCENRYDHAENMHAVGDEDACIYDTFLYEEEGQSYTPWLSFNLDDEELNNTWNYSIDDIGEDVKITEINLYFLYD